jgi:DNA-binding LacI/PurR family transcriptional regulator
MGRAAADLLLGQMRREDDDAGPAAAIAPQHVTIEERLVVRESSAPPVAGPRGA